MKNLQNNLNIQEIQKNLKYKHNIEIFDSIDSTNKYLKSKINEKNYGTIVISNEQTNGYGKNDRQFISNKDTGIYMSILINPNCLIEESLKITILTSVAVLSAIKSVYNLDVKLKWVNDIILNDLKVGGILCESQINLNNNIIDNMIVGIGINVKNFEFPPSLKNIATSIENNTNIKISRNELISEIINFFDLYFIDNKNYLDLYKENSYVLGKDITVIQNDRQFFAKAIDIEDNGALIVQEQEKIIKLISSDISIR
ncbi:MULTISPECIES: biotin--[acetyl-CoA-carboxylase] ligase [Parvimonas]|uniref:biotin--[acetyl-CoA-carboxylase] ligase n=1 Tax=Parvimonas TaxID=543311 RepID=UPI000E4BB96A|nr:MULTISPECIES: biotin--[acetyl-CoA-carboxylase] ligase [Parvimonas]AXU10893.1 biotin--[acetyl-CoA-carboxylase] ligase [Parvimonas micra]MEB3024810.1 biotin--[acetyl-CoA-carboxylase] ligase [Parvimonas sp. M13]MEB3073003.1 biotin--[acetyl-CoA-carboxylase] ligase [Parvimonas sp. C2]MEB3089042.1 biotin--[acetyl-CoA-carboxylase] ligase [Parvimonas sp. M20]